MGQVGLSDLLLSPGAATAALRDVCMWNLGAFGCMGVPQTALHAADTEHGRRTILCGQKVVGFDFRRRCLLFATGRGGSQGPADASCVSGASFVIGQQPTACQEASGGFLFAI